MAKARRKSVQLANLNAALRDLEGFLKDAFCGDFKTEWGKFIATEINPLAACYRAYWKATWKAQADPKPGTGLKAVRRQASGASERAREQLSLCTRELMPAATKALAEICEGRDEECDLTEFHKKQAATERALELLHGAMESTRGVY